MDWINGILAVDKPKEWTSHDVCQFIRKRFGVRKVGHAGILDRTATGVLVVLLGFCTRYSTKFMNEDKDYEGTLTLGEKRSSHDIAGEVLARGDWNQVREDKLREVMESFLGESEQLPPMASAVKYHGVRLYKLARQGREVDRPKKIISVHEIRLIRVSLPDADFFCSVTKGTYVRTLVNDIGERIGCYAYLKDLRRIRSGRFRIEDAVSIEELKSVKRNEDLRDYLRWPYIPDQSSPTITNRL